MSKKVEAQVKREKEELREKITKKFKPVLAEQVADANENGLIVVNKNKLIAEEIAEQVADIILARASGREQTADIWNEENVRLWIYEEVMRRTGKR